VPWLLPAVNLPTRTYAGAAIHKPEAVWSRLWYDSIAPFDIHAVSGGGHGEKIDFDSPTTPCKCQKCDRFPLRHQVLQLASSSLLSSLLSTTIVIPDIVAIARWEPPKAFVTAISSGVR
jgi:hypothetical protein